MSYLRSRYVGPFAGVDEVLHDRPDRVYLVGTLYPRGPAAANLDADELGEDAHDDDLDEPVELANAWYPASVALSFLVDGSEISCRVDAALYEPVAGTHDWRRHVLGEPEVRLTADPTTVRRVAVLDGRANLVSVWRRADAQWLVTVALENAAEHDDAESPPPTEDCLFQVGVRCEVLDGQVLPYPRSTDLSQDPEDQDLRLLYRDRRPYAAGHGCAVGWEQSDDGGVRAVSTDMMPATVVPDVKGDGLDLPVLRLDRLADEAIPAEAICGELRQFVAAYDTWIVDQRREADDLPSHHRAAADRLLDRMTTARDRMVEGIGVLESDAQCLLAFRLANAAMREQILQTGHVRKHGGRRGSPLAPRSPVSSEPRWRPFQLGFQLLSLASTVDATHPDRDVVDLIWFPTGGGKTEAYLGLAAFEMLRRRLLRGARGGGTAVLTRYTLRLLTSQQFQRAATLICALERLREQRDELRGTPGFTIGLWVGGETTPNDFASAHRRTTEMRKTQTPESPYQIQVCPWCATPLLPSRRTNDAGAYGVRTTNNSFELYCPHAECPFHQLLPVSVVDQQMFTDPPTLLVATVDKFARLPWVRDAGSLFGHGSVPFDPPGLVIQDELHLLSGPLGTTVALYESAVQGLLSWHGQAPKIVASTATIRAAGHQVRSLYGREVSLFPPSGLTAEDSFFATTDREAPGRLYVGLMPQAHTASFATVLTCVALLQAPRALGLDGAALDAYWTVVAYHNSLRELGRTVTLTRDDVESMLKAREADPGGMRSLRRDGVVELTSNVRADQLPGLLARLEHGVEQDDAIDLVATTNMLSVGIDIGRLGLMLLNGQPKTTAEYIQATSRVGRAMVPGLVVTLLRAGKPRDRSHYEGFRTYHEALYRHVEPTSVTPWSLASRKRALHAALTILIRHGCGLRDNDQAGDFRADDGAVEHAVRLLADAAVKGDHDEASAVADDLARLVGEWEYRARTAESQGSRLKYRSSSADSPALLRDFGERREGWETMHSMRAVDRQVRVVALGESLR